MTQVITYEALDIIISAEDITVEGRTINDDNAVGPKTTGHVADTTAERQTIESTTGITIVAQEIISQMRIL